MGGWLDGWVFKHSYLWLVYGGDLPPYLHVTASPLVALSVSLRGYSHSWLWRERKWETGRSRDTGKAWCRWRLIPISLSGFPCSSLLLSLASSCLLFCSLPPPHPSPFSFRLARFSGRQRSPPPAWEPDEGLCLFVRLRSALQVSSSVCSAG